MFQSNSMIYFIYPALVSRLYNNNKWTLRGLMQRCLNSLAWCFQQPFPVNPMADYIKSWLTALSCSSVFTVFKTPQPSNTTCLNQKVSSVLCHVNTFFTHRLRVWPGSLSQRVPDGFPTFSPGFPATPADPGKPLWPWENIIPQCYRRAWWNI